jgi:hypothetical protein
MKTLILIALLLIGAASVPLANPACSLSIDLAGDGSINVENYTYGGPDQVAHFCSTATIAYLNGSYLSALSVTNTSVSDGANEYLDADVSGTQLSKSYDPTTGQLTLSGVDSVATYQQVLRSVYYVDAVTSPTVGPRRIDVQASYGTISSNTAVCTLSVQRNPNATPSPKTPVSAIAAAASSSGSISTPTTSQLSQILTPAQPMTRPYVDLSGGHGGPNWSTWTYGGPPYYAHICPSGIVSYAGELTSATITLTTRPDGPSEYLAVQNFALNGFSTQGYNPGRGQLIITGRMDSAVSQALLRSLVYVDLHTSPRTSDRIIAVKVASGSLNSNLATVTMGVATSPAPGRRLRVGTEPLQGTVTLTPSRLPQHLAFLTAQPGNGPSGSGGYAGMLTTPLSPPVTPNGQLESV